MGRYRAREPWTGPPRRTRLNLQIYDLDPSLVWRRRAEVGRIHFGVLRKDAPTIQDVADRSDLFRRRDSAGRVVPIEGFERSGEQENSLGPWDSLPGGYGSELRMGEELRGLDLWRFLLPAQQVLRGLYESVSGAAREWGGVLRSEADFGFQVHHYEMGLRGPDHYLSHGSGVLELWRPGDRIPQGSPIVEGSEGPGEDDE